MFIGSALEKWSNFTSLGSDTLREDEAIQLINYYGKHLLEDMQEQQRHMPLPPPRAQPVSTFQRERVISHASAVPSQPDSIIPPKQVQEEHFNTTNDSIEVKRNYQAEKLRLMQTIQKAQPKIRKPIFPDPYPLAETVKASKNKSKSRSRSQSAGSPQDKKAAAAANKASPPRRRNCFVCVDKQLSPYQRHNDSFNKRIFQRFEFIRKELKRQGVDFPVRENPQNGQTNQQRKQVVSEFIKRMDADRQKRVETETRQSIQRIMSQEGLVDKEQYHKPNKLKNKSVTPAKAEMSVKEKARFKEAKKKRQLEEMYEKTAFVPNVNISRPRTSKFGLGHLKDYLIQKQAALNNKDEKDDRVIHLSTPQQIKFLITS